MKTYLKPALLLLATLAFVASPFLVRNFAGYDPALFPVPVDRPLIQPAGYAFAIWSVIYLWLVVHAGFGLLARADDAGWDRPRWPLILSLGPGAFWLKVATVAPVAATVLIWAMLAAALVALAGLGRRERWLLRAPVALYAGWLTAASAVSLGVVLSGHGILPDRTAALAMLGLALVIAVAVQTRLTASPFYAAAFVWALAGIIVADYARDMTVAVAAGVGIAVVNAALLWRVRSGRRTPEAA